MWDTAVVFLPPVLGRGTSSAEGCLAPCKPRKQHRLPLLLQSWTSPESREFPMESDMISMRDFFSWSILRCWCFYLMDNTDLSCNQHCNAGKSTHHKYCTDIPGGGFSESFNQWYGWLWELCWVADVASNCNLQQLSLVLSWVSLHFTELKIKLGLLYYNKIKRQAFDHCKPGVGWKFVRQNTWGFLLALFFPWKEKPSYCLGIRWQ